MQNVKIRLEGTPEKLNEAIDRLRIVFNISRVSDPYFDSRRNPDIKLCYLTVYMYGDGERRNLYDQMQALKQEIQELQEAIGRLSIENDSLKEQLGQVPKPRPYDAVLGTPHRQKSEPGAWHEG